MDHDTMTPPHGSPLDLLYRLAYRTAYQLLRPWWRLRRPRTSGAGVAIWCDGRLLAVRTSYRGELLDLPGGGVDRGETAEAAAVRVLREEVGIEVPAGALRPGGRFELVLDGGGSPTRCSSGARRCRRRRGSTGARSSGPAG